MSNESSTVNCKIMCFAIRYIVCFFWFDLIFLLMPPYANSLNKFLDNLFKNV